MRNANRAKSPPTRPALAPTDVDPFLDGISSPVLALADDLTVLYCNEAYAVSVGQDCATLIGRRLPEVLSITGERPADAAYRQAIETGRDVDFEGMDGDHYLRVRVHRTPWGVLAIGADMTARHQIEQVITRANTWFARVAGALPVPIITADGTGRIVRANPAARTIFGEDGQIIGRRIAEVLPPPASVPRSGETIWQTSVVDAEGRSRDLEITRSPFDPEDTGAGDLYVAHDISRHAEMSRLREQLLYAVSHELRNPLAVLDNVLEILSEDYAELTTAEFDRLVSGARRTAMRLHRLMDDLLSAGAIESGRFQIRRRPVPAGAIVDEAVDAVAPLLEERKQHLERVEHEAATTVLADLRYAVQVLTNLLTNASKYGPEGSAVRLEVEPLPDSFSFTVEDSGPGIPAEQQPGLFERFYRVRTSAERPGIGLGLAIAKGIVEAHGGAIGVDSAPGKGTRVWFTLPRKDEGGGRDR